VLLDGGEISSWWSLALLCGGVFVRGRKLWLDFWFSQLKNARCREPSGLDDTPENRRTAKAWLDEIRAQIRRGTFEYEKHFPQSTRLPELRDQTQDRVTDTTPMRRQLVRWLAKVSPIRPDGSIDSDGDLMPTTYLSYESIVKHHLLPLLGNRLVGELAEPGVILDLQEALKSKGLGAKRIRNILSALRCALAEPITRRLLPPDVVPPYKAGRRKLGHKPSPLAATEVRSFLDALPANIDLTDGGAITGSCLLDLFTVWFATGWRENEIVAVRFDWLSTHTQEVELRRARSPRRGGMEGYPKTGERRVDCSYAPIIFEAFERRRRASLSTGHRDYVFTDSRGRPLSQEQLHKRVWKPTLRKIGLAERGMNAVRDTFISTAIDRGELPSWVGEVCGTSESMIWRHYRGRIKRPTDGEGMAEALGLSCDRPLSQEPVTARKKP
jgi:integrase